MTDRTTLLLNHVHTPASNATEQEVRGVDIHSHQVDPVAIRDAVPDGTDIVFVRTEHWKPAPYDRISEAVRDRGGTITFHRGHVTFTLGDGHAAIINGVETSLVSGRRHATVGGLPIDTTGTYRGLTLPDLLDLAGDAAWIAPAHPLMPGHRHPDSLVRTTIQAAHDRGIPVALGYLTGQPPLLNALSRGDLPGQRRSLAGYAARYGIPMLPELDLHAALPPALSGAGVIPDTAMDTLRDGTIPVDDILDSHLLRIDGRTGHGWTDTVRTYAATIPGIRRFAPGPAAMEDMFHAGLESLRTLHPATVARHTDPLPA